MTVQKLNLKSETNIFGTTVKLTNKSKSKSWTLAENLPFDPIAKNNKKLENGYLFRYPNADLKNVSTALSHLNQVDDYNIQFTHDSKEDRHTGYVRIADPYDAQFFALRNLENWQKWSDQLEAEEIESAEKVKESKVTVHDDGRVTIDVEVDTLGD
jgi:hypothetical protein